MALSKSPPFKGKVESGELTLDSLIVFSVYLCLLFQTPGGSIFMVKVSQAAEQ